MAGLEELEKTVANLPDEEVKKFTLFPPPPPSLLLWTTKKPFTLNQRR
jgi:hypothetical protein